MNSHCALAGVGVDAVAQAEEPDEWSRTFGTRRLQAPPDWEPPPPREEPKQRGGMPSRSVHGAPININFAGHPGPNGFTGAVGTPGPIGDPGPISMPPRTRPMVIEAEAPAAPARPVDRGRIQELCDHLLCFQAACLAESSGATLDASAMYERYQAWAGTRAIARAAFDTMFSELTAIDRVEFGGVPHYRGVALKGGVALRSVG